MVKVSRRFVAALLAGACLVSFGACSTTSGADTDQHTTGEGSASSAVQQTGGSDPTTGTQTAGATSTGPTTTGPATTTRPSATTSSTTTTTKAMPGGTSRTDALAQVGYLRDGRIALDALREAAEAGAFTENDPTDGSPTGPDLTDDVSAAAGQPATDLCDYLFGTAAEVAALTRLTGAIHLAPLSGPHLTADADDDAAPRGMVVACVYASDKAAQVVLQVGTGAPVDTDLPGQPVIVDGDEVQAVLSYAPDYAGIRIDRRVARDWLTAALGRATAGR